LIQDFAVFERIDGAKTMKKRVVVVAEYFPPRLGADRRIFELTRRLSKKYNIHFVILPPSYTLLIRKIDSSDEEKIEVQYEGMSGHRIRLPRLISRFWTRSFLVAFALTEIYLCFQLLKKIIQLKPHIVIVDHTSVYTGLLGFVCSKIANKKLLVDYNDLMGLYTMELVGKKMNRPLQLILGQILILIEDTLVRYAWKVTTITAFMRNYASFRNVRKDITIIPNGVDTRLFDPAKVNGEEIRFRYDVRNEDTLCVYTGRVEEVAGARIMLETARLLKDQEKVKFMIVGEGNRDMLNELSKLDNVILTGSVSRESIPKYLAAADFVLVPFSNDVASHGISPLKLFEALAMEKPVIASAVSGIKEVASQGLKVILVPNDPNKWASAVQQYIEPHETLIQQRKRSRETVRQKYDFDQLAAVFDKIIESGL
jgi:glycosyltransferase involved in cell wall biosynthesis